MMTSSKIKTTSKMKITSKMKTTSKIKKTKINGGLSSHTIFPTPDTFKSYKWQPRKANWNYSGSGRFGSVGSNSDYNAISASQQSWSLGLAELGNNGSRGK